MKCRLHLLQHLASRTSRTGVGTANTLSPGIDCCVAHHAVSDVAANRCWWSLASCVDRDTSTRVVRVFTKSLELHAQGTLPCLQSTARVGRISS